MLKPRYSKIRDWPKGREPEFIGCYKQYDIWTFVEYLKPGQSPYVRNYSLVAPGARNIGVETPNEAAWRVRDADSNGIELSAKEIAEDMYGSRSVERLDDEVYGMIRNYIDEDGCARSYAENEDEDYLRERYD